MADEISDLLESQKGRMLTIKLRTGKVVVGVLRDFDVHMSMKLESARELSLDTAAAATAAVAAADAAATDAAADGGDDTAREIGSVLLRGDNILMISIPDDDDGDDTPADAENEDSSDAAGER